MSGAWRGRCDSDIIRTLIADLRRYDDPRPILDRFWEAAEISGTPLYEAIPGDSEGIAATFLWRDATGNAEHVALTGGLVLSDFGNNLLTRLAGTDVLHLTLRLPREAWSSYLLAPNDFLQPFQPWSSQDERADRWELDPLNPFRWPSSDNPPSFSIIDRQPDLHGAFLDLLNRPYTGRLDEHWINSRFLESPRRIWLYRPAHSGQNAPAIQKVLWVLDGKGAIETAPVPVIVDQLIETDRLPYTAVVFIDSHSSSERQRDLNYSDAFVSFVQHEVAPLVNTLAVVPADPRHHIITGMSAGGGTALYLGLRCAHLFGVVLAQSSSCAYMPKGQSPRWLYDKYRASPPRNTRFYLSVGVLEIDQVLDIPSLLDANTEFADLLAQLGCSVDFQIKPFGHDLLPYRFQFADSLPRAVDSR